MAHLNLLDTTNTCGQTVLRLVSRGHAIIAETLRISKWIPDEFWLKTKEDVKKYGLLLMDFRYLDDTDRFDKMIEDNQDLVDLDDELRETNLPTIERFYKLFETIFNFHRDLTRFVRDLSEGVFIQHTVEGLLNNTDGKQLLTEVVYLLGAMLLQLDVNVPGPVRERMLVALCRYKGSTSVNNFEDVCEQCRATGFIPGEPAPKRYPEDFFSRFPIKGDLLGMLIMRIKGDDVFNRKEMFPEPRHESLALSKQASMCYVLLFFTPDILTNKDTMMREIVDKHFSDNWVLPYHLGELVDLTVEWQRYPAAKKALGYTMQVENVKASFNRRASRVRDLGDTLRQYLTEGVLTEEYVLDHVQELLGTLRDAADVTRWLSLHRHTKLPKTREIAGAVDLKTILTLLMDAAQFEYFMTTLFEKLLDTKAERWEECKSQCSERMNELAEYFSGERALARGSKDDDLKVWFESLAGKISELTLQDETIAGRKMFKIKSALEEVEQFHQIEASLQVKQFIQDSRVFIDVMIRTANISQRVVDTVKEISDFTYGYSLVQEYIPLMRQQIKDDPFAVVKLRSVFHKQASVLHTPMTRIRQCASPHGNFISEFYSKELILFVRRVLEVVPITLFEVLKHIIDLQLKSLGTLPSKIDKTEIRDYALLEDRFEQNKMTFQISTYTEGILAMETTLVGAIAVKPRQLLEDGIRKELVSKITGALHRGLQFTGMDAVAQAAAAKAAKAKGKHFEAMTPVVEFETKLRNLYSTLEGFRMSFEYIQDYVNLYGLKIWQEEFCRIINFNVEQECNTFLKKKIFEWQSDYQSVDIPIPHPPPVDKDSRNFMGRVARQLFLLTEPLSTRYFDGPSAWLDAATGREVVSMRTIALLHKGLGIFGLMGVDRLLCFMVVRQLHQFIKFARNDVASALKKSNDGNFARVWPCNDGSLPPGSSMLLPDPATVLPPKLADKMWPHIRDAFMRLGQAQLLRRLIGNELKFACKLDSNMLSCALTTMNLAILMDVEAHYSKPDKHPYPSDDNPLLAELTTYLESSGVHDPLAKIYVTCEHLALCPMLVSLFVLNYIPKLYYNREYGVLQRRASCKEPLDGTPLIVGIATFLKQFHSMHLHLFMDYLGRYVVQQVTANAELGGSGLPEDIITLLVFVEELLVFADLPRKVVEAVIPPHVFDTFKAMQATVDPKAKKK